MVTSTWKAPFWSAVAVAASALSAPVRHGSRSTIRSPFRCRIGIAYRLAGGIVWMRALARQLLGGPKEGHTEEPQDDPADRECRAGRPVDHNPADQLRRAANHHHQHASYLVLADVARWRRVRRRHVVHDKRARQSAGSVPTPSQAERKDQGAAIAGTSPSPRLT